MKTDCCCCFDLTVGTILLLIYEIMVVIISFIIIGVKNEISSDAVIVIYTLIRLGAAVLGLCGVFLKKSKFLMPFLFTSIITSIALTIVGVAFFDDVEQMLNFTNSNHDGVPYPYTTPIIVVSICIGLSVHFVIVIWRYIAQLKETEETKKSANQNTIFVA